MLFAVLAEDAIRSAIRDYRTKRSKMVNPQKSGAFSSPMFSQPVKLLNRITQDLLMFRRARRLARLLRLLIRARLETGLRF
jgi:hypothetical protein